MRDPQFSVGDVLEIAADIGNTKLLSTREAAQKLGVQVADLRKWAADDLVPWQRVAGRLVFSTSELARWQLQGLRCLAMKPTGQFLA